MRDVALAPWARLVSIGTEHAMSGLSQMVGQEIEVEGFSLRQIPVASVSQLVGGPEVISVGIHLTISGAADGVLMLIYEPTTACAFVDLMMQRPPDTTQTLGAMERSALGEMGNVIGSAFLSALADATGLDLRPSPPAVIIDMAGALLDVVAASIMLTQDETYLAQNVFSAGDRRISGTFFVIPSVELQEALLDARLAA